ncbi:hypothetical protein [Streptomyces sp. NPDC101776]|uniref:hypothetical protein n=1 Tax=Streptomyces sp. NPDC101776 TaxID=3366146 RepID=UPI003814A979
MSDRRRWIRAAAGFVVWWCLVTVSFRLVGLVIGDSKSWPTCAEMAAVSVVTGELSERWHQRRRKTKPQASPNTAPGTDDLSFPNAEHQPDVH